MAGCVTEGCLSSKMGLMFFSGVVCVCVHGCTQVSLCLCMHTHIYTWVHMHVEAGCCLE